MAAIDRRVWYFNPCNEEWELSINPVENSLRFNRINKLIDKYNENGFWKNNKFRSSSKTTTAFSCADEGLPLGYGQVFYHYINLEGFNVFISPTELILTPQQLRGLFHYSGKDILGFSTFIMKSDADLGTFQSYLQGYPDIIIHELSSGFADFTTNTVQVCETLDNYINKVINIVLKFYSFIKDSHNLPSKMNRLISDINKIKLLLTEQIQTTQDMLTAINSIPNGLKYYYERRLAELERIAFTYEMLVSCYKVSTDNVKSLLSKTLDIEYIWESGYYDLTPILPCIISTINAIPTNIEMDPLVPSWSVLQNSMNSTGLSNLSVILDGHKLEFSDKLRLICNEEMGAIKNLNSKVVELAQLLISDQPITTTDGNKFGEYYVKLRDERNRMLQTLKAVDSSLNLIGMQISQLKSRTLEEEEEEEEEEEVVENVS